MTKYTRLELHEDFADGPELYPGEWNPILWADEENAAIQADPEFLPVEGEIVAILRDARVNPSEAYHIKIMNQVDLTPPENSNVIETYIYHLFNKKHKIRQVNIARYDGLDSFGFPSFVYVGSGSENYNRGTVQRGEHFLSDIVAWHPLNIPFLPDVEI